MKVYLLINTETNRCYASSIIKDDKRFKHMKEEYSECHDAEIFEFDDNMDDPNHSLVLNWMWQGSFAQCIDMYKVNKQCKLIMLKNMDTFRYCTLVSTEIEKIIIEAYNQGYEDGFHHAVVMEEEEEE